MAEYDSAEDLNLHAKAVVNIAIQRAAQQVVLADVRNGTDKLSKALMDSLSNMALPEGIRYEVSLHNLTTTGGY